MSTTRSCEMCEYGEPCIHCLSAEVDRLQLAIQRIFRDRREADKITAECLSVMPKLCESERPFKADTSPSA